MKKVNAIIKNNTFINTVKNIEEYEKSRIYCRHGINHLFDTARICYIINLEENYGFDKEIIYAAALLHDVGRYAEYKDNVPHDKAGAKLAGTILDECNFSESEKKVIIDAILHHREENDVGSLGAVLYMGDKLSRKCFMCSAEPKCKWSSDKKIFFINF